MILENKTAIVTGGASGIGKAIALKFASEGANVHVIDLQNLSSFKNTSDIDYHLDGFGELF